MDLKKVEIYHTPTDKTVTCLCLNMAQFTADCEEYIISRYSRFTVNPKERFYSKIDKLVDEIIRELKKAPFTFRMRLDSRHCIENRHVHFKFHFLDKACLQGNTFFNGLSEEEKEMCSDTHIDYVIVYEIAQVATQDNDTNGKDGFCGHKPQVPSLSDGACPARD